MKDNKQNRDELKSSGQESSDETEDRDWSEVPNDPDPAALGYEREEWERITVSESDQVVFLPGNEEDVEDDAFVVSDVSALCDLSTRR